MTLEEMIKEIIEMECGGREPFITEEQAQNLAHEIAERIGVDEKWAFNFGAMFIRALQGDYELVDYYAREVQIDFKDGKPIMSALAEAGIIRGEKYNEYERK